MRNRILVICAVFTLIFTSCKNETPKTEQPVAAKKVENIIVLSKYSDNNWKSGVAVDLNMFLVDNTKENLELVKKAKKFVFADGTFATITGFKEQEGFIQVNTLEKASTFSQAAYPFEITVE